MKVETGQRLNPSGRYTALRCICGWVVVVRPEGDDTTEAVIAAARQALKVHADNPGCRQLRKAAEDDQADLAAALDNLRAQHRKARSRG